jgi:2-oxoisovalerate dehydrogenase E1 component
MRAADLLLAEGIEASVLDLRWLSPLDDEAIEQAVQENDGRVLVVHEANVTGGVGAEIAARISERHWPILKTAVRRIGTRDVRMPASPILQQAVLPSADDIVRAARALKNEVAKQ